MQKHRKLPAWQLCIRLAIRIYEVTRTFPAEERYGLTAQLRRAAISAAANIAEGHARLGPRELAHFLSLSLGSLAEIDTLFEVALRTGALSTAVHFEVDDLRSQASRATFALQRGVRAA